MSAEKAYLTTPIFYPNGVPHIGHAYEAIATDAIARFKRLDGKDVFFLTGTDEHGLKMQQTAGAGGPHAAGARRPQLGALPRHGGARSAAPTTTSSAPPRRATTRSSQEIWRRMEANGDIYLDNYAGWYSVRDEAYFDEEETTLGDDGVRRGPQGTPVEWIEEESYFFRLSAYQDRLLALYESQPGLHPARTSGATRSSASSRAGCRTCRSRAPPSTGASRCPAIPSTSCMSGSMR